MEKSLSFLNTKPIWIMSSIAAAGVAGLLFFSNTNSIKSSKNAVVPMKAENTLSKIQFTHIDNPIIRLVKSGNTSTTFTLKAYYSSSIIKLQIYDADQFKDSFFVIMLNESRSLLTVSGLSDNTVYKFRVSESFEGNTNYSNYVLYKTVSSPVTNVKFIPNTTRHNSVKVSFDGSVGSILYKAVAISNTIGSDVSDNLLQLSASDTGGNHTEITINRLLPATEYSVLIYSYNNDDPAVQNSLVSVGVKADNILTANDFIKTTITPYWFVPLTDDKIIYGYEPQYSNTGQRSTTNGLSARITKISTSFVRDTERQCLVMNTSVLFVSMDYVAPQCDLSFTKSIWGKLDPNADIVSNSSSIWNLMSQGSYAGANSLNMTANGYIETNIDFDLYTTYKGTTHTNVPSAQTFFQVTKDTWVHYAVSYVGTQTGGKLTLYIDGEPMRCVWNAFNRSTVQTKNRTIDNQNYLTVSTTGNSTATFDTSPAFLGPTIDTYIGGGNNLSWQGQLSQAALYPCMDDQQIQNLYQSQRVI